MLPSANLYNYLENFKYKITYDYLCNVLSFKKRLCNVLKTNNKVQNNQPVHKCLFQHCIIKNYKYTTWLINKQKYK